MDFGGVNADEDGGASDHEKGVVAEAAGLGIGKENECGQEKKKEKKESVAGESRLLLGRRCGCHGRAGSSAGDGTPFRQLFRDDRGSVSRLGDNAEWIATRSAELFGYYYVHGDIGVESAGDDVEVYDSGAERSQTCARAATAVTASNASQQKSKDQRRGVNQTTAATGVARKQERRQYCQKRCKHEKDWRPSSGAAAWWKNRR